MESILRQAARALEAEKGYLYRTWAAAFFSGSRVIPVPGSAPTAFDLASLTKPLATALLVQQAVAAGLMAFDERLDLHPDRPRVDDLLRHAAGLPAYDHRLPATVARTPEARAELYRRLAVRWRVTADRPQYSDIGYLGLGIELERRFRQPLDQRFQRLLGADEPLGFRSLGRPWMLPAPPVYDPSGVPGRVDDPAARVFGGVAGHAGLWGTVSAVARFLGRLLRGEFRLAAPDRFWRPEPVGFRFTLGLDTPTGPETTAGAGAPPDTVGHLGHTGCSFWLSPLLGGGSVLLTDRYLRQSEPRLLHPLRRSFHALGWRFLASS